MPSAITSPSIGKSESDSFIHQEEDPVSTFHRVRTGTVLRSPDSSSISPIHPELLSTAVIHKRRPQKRVRFALELESVEADLVPSEQVTPASVAPKSSRRIFDPWKQSRSLYGAYIEYLEKQNRFSSGTSQYHRTVPSPPRPPPPPEPGAEPPTYTHTFVIQNQSPEVVIDSITVSTPPFHLPRIIDRTKKTTEQQSLPVESSLKQQLTISSTPYMSPTKKLPKFSNQKSRYASVLAALKQTESKLPATLGLHPNNRYSRSDYVFASKSIADQPSTKMKTQITTKVSSCGVHQINHFAERSILPNHSRKPRMHDRTAQTNEQSNTGPPYFLHYHDNDQLLRTILRASP